MADSDIFVSNDIELDVDFGEIYVIDQGAVTKVVASKYDPTKTYVVGDYVIHLEKLYKCITAIEEPEEFNSEKWTNVLLANEVQALNVVVPTKADKSDTYTKQEVNTALADKADKADTYTKQEVDTAVGAKADKSDTYTKQDVNDALALKADKADTYTKSDVNEYLDLKADKSDTYTKQEVDTAVGEKADSDDVYDKSETYSKTEVDNIISNLPAPMIFKGTLGTGGTISDLPTASDDNEGHTYKVITDGTYASQAAKAGDMFTSNGSAWIYIPSGDETFTDTWRGIKVNGTEKLGSAISSGEVDFINGTNTIVSFNSTGNKIKVDVDGYTQAQVDTKLSVKANSADVYTKSATDDKLALKANSADVYNKTTTDNKLALKADKSTTYTKTEVDNLVNLIGTVSGDIASFETTLPEPYPSVTVNVHATGGNGTPDNPNPINGYSSANITRCGVNLLDPTTSSKIGVSISTWAYPPDNEMVAFLNALDEGDYTLTLKCRIDAVNGSGTSTYGAVINNSVSGQAQCRNIDETPTVGDIITQSVNFTITASSKGNFDNYWWYTGRAGTPDTCTFYDVQIAKGLNVPFSPYNGQTYAISFGQTVYGGVLDVTRGKLTVTHGEMTLGTGFAKDGNNRYYKRLGADFNAKVYSGNEVANAVCECYNAISPNNYNGRSLTGVTIATSLSQPTIMIYDADYNDTAANFDALIKDYKLVYELTTPFDIDLTPVQIRALVGVNNVFADCGETEVEYINSNAEDTITVMQTVGGASTHTYSTDEQIVGTWVDGSTLYEKTIYNAGGTYGTISIPHNITNLGHCVSAIGTSYDIGYREGSQRIGAGDLPLPRVASDGNNVGIVGVNSTNINLMVPNAFQDRVTDIYITLQYTKSSS